MLFDHKIFLNKQVYSSLFYICDQIWQNQASTHIQYSLTLVSRHDTDLEFSYNFVIYLFNSRLKFETDGLLLLRVIHLQTCKIGCVWKPGFVKSGPIWLRLKFPTWTYGHTSRVYFDIHLIMSLYSTKETF